MAKILDGTALSQSIRGEVASGVVEMQQKHGVTPGLAAVLVGDDPASHVYVRNKGKQTEEAGMVSVEHRLAVDAPEQELLGLIDRVNSVLAVNGILVQLPLPDQIDEQKVTAAISPEKDVDGFHPMNMGRLACGLDATALIQLL